MTAPADPGATPTAARSLAPDLARGGMLLLIALANVHVYVHGSPLAVRGYPRVVEGMDRVVVLLQMLLVDGRAYPLFGLLFGYGIVQLAWRRGDAGLPVGAVTRLVRRRGFSMVAIGFAHGVLLFAGDIVGAYGLIAVLLAGVLVGGRDGALLGTAAAGIALATLLYTAAGAPLQGEIRALLGSIAAPDAATALVLRVQEWLVSGLLSQVLAVFGAVALGAWAARRRILDEPERHRALLVRAAALGLAAAVLGGLPLGLMAAQLWATPPLGVALLAGALHGLGGYAGGVGYAALFGLLAIRLARGGVGPVGSALQACGQRSLSCYLAQSVAFVALLPAWTLGLGEQARLWQVALVGLGTWLVILAVAAASARAGFRGPAEILLRRLTYGPRSAVEGRPG
ncbi:DUF418 domain-containing protein [Pseudonocardia nigra]|uniref:DUF418 domain-containing protein n=1 Tax=Pseudonocardia nigra TaxID=1921578 RepID=UPI001C6011B5|nr:DUF418 domain-containing protein [Pseudonocardia nigra]